MSSLDVYFDVLFGRLFIMELFGYAKISDQELHDMLRDQKRSIDKR